MQNSFRTFKIPILYFDEKSASKLDIYRYIIKSLYENYKRTDNYISEENTSIGGGTLEFLANLLYNGGDAILAYESCLANGHLKRHEHEAVKNKDVWQATRRLLQRCCKSEDELPIALYSNFTSISKVFQLTPTPLYYSIKEFVNSLDGEEFILSNELVIIPKK